MKIIFLDIYHNSITDEYGYKKEFYSEHCLIPDKKSSIRLDGKFWEVDEVIYNYDSMEIEIILNKDR